MEVVNCQPPDRLIDLTLPPFIHIQHNSAPNKNHQPLIEDKAPYGIRFRAVIICFGGPPS